MASDISGGKLNVLEVVENNLSFVTVADSSNGLFDDHALSLLMPRVEASM